MEAPRKLIINILTAMHVDKHDPLTLANFPETLRSLRAVFEGHEVRHFLSVSGLCPSALRDMPSQCANTTFALPKERESGLK